MPKASLEVKLMSFSEFQLPHGCKGQNCFTKVEPVTGKGKTRQPFEADSIGGPSHKQAHGIVPGVCAACGPRDIF